MDPLTWAATAVGRGASVVRQRRLRGAAGAIDIRAIDVEARSGVVHKLVLRRYIDPGWLQLEPDLAAREAVTLTLLAPTPVAAPELVAVDPDGTQCGTPAVLMTRLAGKERWVPPSIPRLAEVAVAIHEVTPPVNFRRYRRYHAEPERPPAWCTDPHLWERSIEIAQTATYDETQAGFIHRDHHPGNVLWSRGRVTGVVDWVEACTGPIAVDAARCRVNLWDDAGRGAADEYARCDGIVVDPVWDIVDGCDWLWGSGPDPEVQPTLEAFLAQALAELGSV